MVESSVMQKVIYNTSMLPYNKEKFALYKHPQDNATAIIYTKKRQKNN